MPATQRQTGALSTQSRVPARPGLAYCYYRCEETGEWLAAIVKRYGRLATLCTAGGQKSVAAAVLGAMEDAGRVRSFEEHPGALASDFASTRIRAYPNINNLSQ